MDIDFLLKIVVLIVGFYMAWNIGANDVSNAMGTSVGSGALTLRKAVIIAAFLEFGGAFLLGGNVSETMQSGLIDTSQFIANPRTLTYGMCGALLGTGIWLQFASYFGLPVSTTHAIVGAITGFGAWTLGFSGIEWHMIGSIALSWVVSPLVSGIVAYVIFSVLQHRILFALDPHNATKKCIPFLLFFVFGAFSLSFIFNGLGGLHLHISFAQALLISIVCGILAAIIGFTLVRRLSLFQNSSYSKTSQHVPQTLVSLEKAIKHLRRVRGGSVDETSEKITSLLEEMHKMKNAMRSKIHIHTRPSEYEGVEKAFGYMQIISACFVAFAHGANDVANAIAPVAAVLDTIKRGGIATVSEVPLWLLAFGGAGIVIGLATWGWRVIETIGKKITELTPTRGFSAEFGAALTILIASKLGMPISTTHCLVGAVLGVGIAGGIRAINLRTVREIALSWVITIPASALMSILCYYMLRIILS